MFALRKEKDRECDHTVRFLTHARQAVADAMMKETEKFMSLLT